MKGSKLQSSTIFIATIVATGSIAINSAIPSAPAVEATLGLVRGGSSEVIAFFVIGYAIGHLVVGLFAPSVPQRELLLAGLAGFIICSVAIGYNTDSDAFRWLRGLQGAFASVCPIIGRALVRNIGSSKLAAKKMSGASAIFTWAPVFAPLLAAAITAEFGWRAVYFALAAYGSASAIWVLYSPKERFSQHRRTFRIREIPQSLIAIVRHPVARSGVIVGSLAFAAFFSILAVAPNLVAEWQSSPISLSLIVTLYSGGYAVGAILSRITLNYVRENQVLMINLILLILAGISLGFVTYLKGGLVYQVGCSVICAIAAGAIMPNATMLAISPPSRIAPFSLAFLGMTKMGLAAAGTTMAGLTSLSAGAYVTIVSLICGIASLFVLLVFTLPQSRSHGLT